ncbi:hypothetical protein [Legionella spiritensis]|uniref:Uncharacterized protein n=1 Tax=Legionella spiritensis TaxID=452 RepID=A0A0W0Z703_LEGSP|nr:hypothetical protein [Legionella spiritensis]KTD64703.1 hypothetical protein Lspi_0870 [Legionella spiritensis]SNV47956.1 Uncharacterised protein [Legionella spiritensis]
MSRRPTTSLPQEALSAIDCVTRKINRHIEDLKSDLHALPNQVAVTVNALQLLTRAFREIEFADHTLSDVFDRWAADIRFRKIQSETPRLSEAISQHSTIFSKDSPSQLSKNNTRDFLRQLRDEYGDVSCAREIPVRHAKLP